MTVSDAGICDPGIVFCTFIDKNHQQVAFCIWNFDKTSLSGSAGCAMQCWP